MPVGPQGGVGDPVATSSARSGLDRIAATFARAGAERRLAVIVYLTVGFPERHSTAALLGAALDGGADALELGVPFSDPLADGATVQRAGEQALLNGVGLRDCLSEARSIVEERGATALLMGYTNPFLRYGPARLAADARDAGVAGVIVPDLPAEECAVLDDSLVPAGVARIDLYAPTTPDDRLERLLPRSRGFVYCVSLTGVTGARQALPQDVNAFVARVRERTSLPLALGFGIARPEQVAGLRGQVDGVVIGSAAIDVVANAEPSRRADALRAFVASMVAAGRS